MKTVGEVAGNRPRIRAQSLVGEHDRAFVVDQRHSVDHRVESAAPTIAHSPDAVGQVVDGDQEALLGVTSKPTDAELHLRPYNMLPCLSS